jgi:hypothetical protein
MHYAIKSNRQGHRRWVVRGFLDPLYKVSLGSAMPTDSIPCSRFGVGHPQRKSTSLVTKKNKFAL